MTFMLRICKLSMGKGAGELRVVSEDASILDIRTLYDPKHREPVRLRDPLPHLSLESILFMIRVIVCAI